MKLWVGCSIHSLKIKQQFLPEYTNKCLLHRTSERALSPTSNHHKPVYIWQHFNSTGCLFCWFPALHGLEHNKYRISLGNDHTIWSDISDRFLWRYFQVEKYDLDNAVDIFFRKQKKFRVKTGLPVVAECMGDAQLVTIGYSIWAITKFIKFDQQINKSPLLKTFFYE